MIRNIVNFGAYAKPILDKYAMLFNEVEKTWSNFLDFGPAKDSEYSKLAYYPYIGTKLGINDLAYVRYAERITLLHEKLKRNEISLEKIKDVLSMAHSEGLGTSLGLNKYFDSGLSNWNMRPGIKAKFHAMLLIVAHDWYPLARKHKNQIEYFEPPLSNYGLFSDDAEEISMSPYKQSVAHIDQKQILVGFINLIPGYRKEFVSTAGEIAGADYTEKAALVVELATHLKNQFDYFKIVIWGKTASHYLSETKDFQAYRLYHPGTYRNTMMRSAVDYAYFTSDFQRQT